MCMTARFGGKFISRVRELAQPLKFSTLSLCVIVYMILEKCVQLSRVKTYGIQDIRPLETYNFSATDVLSTNFFREDTRMHCV